jgi:hypothetical protein
MAHFRDFLSESDGEFDGWLANQTAYVDSKTHHREMDAHSG